MKKRRRRRFVQISMLFVGLSLFPICLCSASIIEMAYGTRLVPWSAYPSCGETTPETLPKTVRIGFYEEFPVPWRLETLSQIDFPVSLAVTASSRAEFLQLRESIWATYPQVETVYFWPILSKDEGYYPGAWSYADAVQQMADEADGLPTLWDMELPLEMAGVSPVDFWRNGCLRERNRYIFGDPMRQWVLIRVFCD